MLTGWGAQDLLDAPLTAFFASRQCPGAAIRAALDWALESAKSQTVVVSGFHSPLEKSVLKILLTANAPAVMVLARDAATATIPPELRRSVDAGRLTVISTVGAEQGKRLTSKLSHARNELVASLSQFIVVAHASPVGQLARQVTQWQEVGRTIRMLS